MIRARGYNFKSAPSGLLVPTAVDEGSGLTDITHEMVGPADATKVLVGTNPPTWATPTASPTLAIVDKLVAGSSIATFDTNTELGGNLPTTSPVPKHLELYCQLKGTSAVAGISMNLRFNNDAAGTSYIYAVQYAQGPTSTAQGHFESSTDTGIDPSAGGTIPGGTPNVAGSFATVKFTIFDWNSTTAKKMVRAKFGALYNTTRLFVCDASGIWLNTAAITRIQVVPSAGNWDIGCRFTLVPVY